jgi:photosystem II stability/assembly factor-like uncharacterized protein
MRVSDNGSREDPSAPVWKLIGPKHVTGLVDANGNSILPCAGLIYAIDFSSNYDAAGHAAMYLGTNGGVWRSTDFNSGYPTWVALTDHLPGIHETRRVNLNEIFTLAVDPNQPQTIFASAGGSPPALLRSTDGGNDWDLIGQDQFVNKGKIRRVLVDPLGDVYVGFDYGGFWKSTDSGDNWTNLATHNLSDVGFRDAVYFVDLNGQINIYVGVIDPHNTDPTRSRSGIWWFANGNWTKMQMTLNNMLWQQFNRNVINHITLSSDPDAGVCASLSQVDDKQSKIGLLNVFKLIRGTWQPQWFSSPVDDEAWISTQGGYTQGICIAPEGRIYAGGIGLAQSGLDVFIPVRLQNFVPIIIDANGNSIHVDVHAIVFYNGKVYVGTDGGLFRFTPRPDKSGVDTWESLNSHSLTNFLSSGASSHPIDSDVFLVGNQDNGIARSFGAWDWRKCYLSNEREKIRFDPGVINQGRYAVSGDPGNGFYLSHDGGISFQGLYTLTLPPGDVPDDSPAFSFHPNNSARIMVGLKAVLETPDRGATWNKKLNLAGFPTAMSYVGDQAAYIAANGQLFQTLNIDDTNWDNVPVPWSQEYVNSICGDSANPNAVYVATQSRVYRRLTPQAQWEELTGNLHLEIKVMALCPSQSGADPLLFAGTGAGVFVATRLNGANTSWSRFGSGLPDVFVEDLEVRPDKRLLVAATWGRGAWTVSGW